MAFARFLGFPGLLSLALPSPAAATDTLVAMGEAVFNSVCIACHYSNDRDPLMAAPPIFAAKHRYADFADRESFVAAMASYVRAPSEAASLMPEEVERSGLMPAQEITEAEARAVAEFLYATEFELPDWYIEDYLAEHGAGPGGS